MSWNGYDPFAQCAWSELRGELGGEIGDEHGTREGSAGDVDERYDVGGAPGRRPVGWKCAWELTPALPTKTAMPVVAQRVAATAPPAGIVRTVPLSHPFHGRARLAVGEKNARERQAAQTALQNDSATDTTEGEDMAKTEELEKMIAAQQRASDAMARNMEQMAKGMQQLTQIMQLQHQTQVAVRPAGFAAPPAGRAAPPAPAPSPPRPPNTPDVVLAAIAEIMERSGKGIVGLTTSELNDYLLHHGCRGKRPAAWPTNLHGLSLSVGALQPRLMQAGYTLLRGERLDGQREFSVYHTHSIPQRVAWRVGTSVLPPDVPDMPDAAVPPAPVAASVRRSSRALRSAPDAPPALAAVPPAKRRSPTTWIADIAFSPDATAAFVGLADEFSLHGEHRIEDAFPLIEMVPELAAILNRANHPRHRKMAVGAMLQTMAAHGSRDGASVRFRIDANSGRRWWTIDRAATGRAAGG